MLEEKKGEEKVKKQITDPQSVFDAIETRFSARAFLAKPVARELIEKILSVSMRAPSGTNTQPWKVYVLQGAKRDAVVAQTCAAVKAVRDQPELAKDYAEAYDYYPREWISPFIDRRRENGWGLYGLLGITKGDKDKMFAQNLRNFEFFDAPVGLMFTIHKAMGGGSLVDCGMFIENIMITARALGLHTCPQAAWNPFAKIIKPLIGAGEEEILVCGMALGYADEAEIVNTFHTPRVPVREFTTWLE